MWENSVSVNISIAKNQQGFTLAELNVSIAILAVLIVSILGVFTNYFVLLTRNSITLKMGVDSQNLLRTVTEELRYGAGIRQTNSLSDPNAPSGGWNTNNTSFVIITTIPAVDAANEYIIDPLTGSPYLNELVYFKQGSTMHKRTLAHPSATGNSMKRSCPAAIATASCPADKILIDNVSTMVFNLYDQDNASTTSPLEARSVTINLSLLKDTFGNPIKLDNSIRVTLRNNFQ